MVSDINRMNTHDDRTVGEAHEDARYEAEGCYDGPDAEEVYMNETIQCLNCGAPTTRANPCCPIDWDMYED